MTLIQQLTTLESAELIRPIDENSNLEYIFRHALIQDAAYGSLVRSDRKQLNLAVGQTLEQLFPERLEEYAPRLARHFSEAGDEIKTLHYATQAGDAAARLYANQEAAALYTRAIEAAQHSHAPIDKLIHLYEARGRALELLGNFEQALSHYGQMLDAAHELHSPQMELSALMSLGTLQAHATSVHDPAKAKRVTDQALALSREINDYQAEAKILWNTMLQRAFSGQTDEAIGYGEQSLAIARKFNLREQLAFTLHDLAFHGYYAKGEFTHSTELLTEARGLWQKLNNQPMLADNYGGSAIIHYVRGEFDAALADDAEALRISERIGNLWGQAYGRWVMGDIHFTRGEIDRAIEVSKACIALADQTGFAGAQIGIRSRLALIYGSLGAIERGIEIAEAALALADHELADWRYWPLGNLVRLLSWQGNATAAAALLAEAADFSNMGHFEMRMALPLARIELALIQRNFEMALTEAGETLALLQRIEARMPRVEVLLFKALALYELQKFDSAEHTLRQARSEAQALGARWLLWKIFDLQCQIKSRVDQAAEAEVYHGMAKMNLEFVSSHTPIELRGTFLNLPEVHRVIS